MLYIILIQQFPGKEQEDPAKIIEAVKESFILIDKKMRDLHDKMDGFGNSGNLLCILIGYK